MGSIIWREVNKRVCFHIQPVQGIQYLPDTPVQFLHIVAERAVFGPTTELPRCMERCVHLYPRHKEKEGGLIASTGLQELQTFLSKLLCQIFIQSNGLLYYVVTSHQDGIHEFKVPIKHEEEGRSYDTQEDQRREDAAVVAGVLEEQEDEEPPARDGRQQGVHVGYSCGHHTLTVVTEVLQVGQRQAIEVIEALAHRMVLVIFRVARVQSQMPFP